MTPIEHLDTSLELLRPVLDSWSHITQVAAGKFSQSSEAERFTESTYCGLLASAAWGAEVPSIVEQSRLGASGRGQVDGVLCLPTGDLLIEAKVNYLSHPDALGEIDDALADACRQVAARHGTDPRVGARFVVLQDDGYVSKEEVESAVHGHLSTIKPDLAMRATLDPTGYWFGVWLLGRLVNAR